MHTNSSLNLQSFYPAFIHITHQHITNEAIQLTLKSTTKEASCPICGSKSTHYHSTYVRKIADLPILGRSVMLHIKAYRYYCINTQCEIKVFAEEMNGFTGKYRRRTQRLENLIIRIASQANCEGTARICNDMGISISGDSVIRLLKRNYTEQETTLTEIIGIDDWAYKKRHTYGTIICDGVTHKPITLLDGRDGSSLKQWLENNQHIKIITRDRASAYAKVISEVIPDAIQVADRFHLYQNLFQAVKESLSSVLPNRILISAIPSDKVEIENDSSKVSKKMTALTDYEKRRKEDIITVQKLLSEGYTPSSIRAVTGHTYRTIRKFKEGDPDILCQSMKKGKRPTKLDPYQDFIVEQLSSGMILKNILDLLKENGYDGKPTFFYSYCKRLMEEKDIPYHTRTNTVGQPINRNKMDIRYIHRKDILMYLWVNKDLGEEDRSFIFDKYPTLDELYNCVRDFREVFDSKLVSNLELYLDTYKDSSITKIKTFITGLNKDLDAVKQAVESSLSNGFVEGNNSRLKMIKRMMYGRASLELLKAKIML